MNVSVTNISGFEDAFVAMYMSKRSWTPEIDREIRKTCLIVESAIKLGMKDELPFFDTNKEKFDKWLSMALRMGKKHITILRFIDISIMTEGLHRAGQDDVDAHARRFDNRIIRNSTRLATYKDGEVSDWYKDKILTTDAALKSLGVDIPDSINVDGKTYVKSTNGYILEEFKDNKDVKRGLYMLSIPSNFVSKINLTEWAHVFKERNKDGGANPEVKEWAESVMSGITELYPEITRDYVLSIEN